MVRMSTPTPKERKINQVGKNIADSNPPLVGLFSSNMFTSDRGLKMEALMALWYFVRVCTL